MPLDEVFKPLHVANIKIFGFYCNKRSPHLGLAGEEILPIISTDFFKDCYLSKFAPEIEKTLCHVI